MAVKRTKVPTAKKKSAAGSGAGKGRSAPVIPFRAGRSYRATLKSGAAMLLDGGQMLANRCLRVEDVARVVDRKTGETIYGG